MGESGQAEGVYVFFLDRVSRSVTGRTAGGEIIVISGLLDFYAVRCFRLWRLRFAEL